MGAGHYRSGRGAGDVFEVGFVLLLPLVFTVVASSGLPLLYVGYRW
jgi:Gnt-II system L-idonate transporter